MNCFLHFTINKGKKIFSKFSNKKVFIVHGKKSYSLCGAKDIFDRIFKALNCNVLEHFDFSENPKWEEINIGVNKYKEFEPDIILAVGGGSVIDTAKLIRFFSTSKGNPSNYIETEKSKIPFYVFPTTSGTGSEATHFAVCYLDGKKYSVASKNILPTKTFIDYRFTLSNSQYLTACTGLDALSQGIESYWSVNSTKESRRYSIKAINNIYSYLLDCINSPTEKSRKALSRGSFYAGKAINISFTTAPHAYSYGITSKFGLPHGHAVAISLPYFFEYNYNVTQENCNDIRGVKFVQKRMNYLKKILHLKKYFKKELTEYINSVLKKDNIQTWFDNNWESVSNTVNKQRLNNNPVKVN